MLVPSVVANRLSLSAVMALVISLLELVNVRKDLLDGAVLRGNAGCG